MKKIQTRILKSLGICAGMLMFCLSLAAQPNAYLAKADTLFKKKQFVQSFELYESLFKQKKYSPAMLLKMAYIQEGLGHVSQSLYYLTLYYKISHDETVLAKIEEVANNNKLEGYAESPSGKLFTLLDKYRMEVTAALATIIVFILAIGFFRKRRHLSARPLAVVAAFFMVILAFHINFSIVPKQGIIANPYTYIMTGPSAGAAVIGIVGSGHQIEILGHKDVWVRVKWNEKEGYLREGSLLVI